MSDDQFAALLAKLNVDAALRDKLQGAEDLDAAVAMAKEAGFDINEAEWLGHQANQTIELSDEELECVAGGQRRSGQPEVAVPILVDVPPLA